MGLTKQEENQFQHIVQLLLENCWSGSVGDAIAVAYELGSK